MEIVIANLADSTANIFEQGNGDDHTRKKKNILNNVPEIFFETNFLYYK